MTNVTTTTTARSVKPAKPAKPAKKVPSAAGKEPAPRRPPLPPSGLRKARIAAGFTAKQAAKKLEISVGYLLALEREGMGTERFCLRAAALYRCSINHFIFDRPGRPKQSERALEAAKKKKAKARAERKARRAAEAAAAVAEAAETTGTAAQREAGQEPAAAPSNPS